MVLGAPWWPCGAQQVRALQWAVEQACPRGPQLSHCPGPSEPGETIEMIYNNPLTKWMKKLTSGEVDCE